MCSTAFEIDTLHERFALFLFLIYTINQTVRKAANLINVAVKYIASRAARNPTL